MPRRSGGTIGRWPRWAVAPLAVITLLSCSVSGERRMFAEQFDVPSDYELLTHYVWTGELGKIGGGVVDIFVVDPTVNGSGEVAAAKFCAERSRGAVVERTVAEVPADWESCSFESMEQRVLVGTYARFKGYRKSLAEDACGANRCDEDSLVVWID